MYSISFGKIYVKVVVNEEMLLFKKSKTKYLKQITSLSVNPVEERAHGILKAGNRTSVLFGCLFSILLPCGSCQRLVLTTLPSETITHYILTSGFSYSCKYEYLIQIGQPSKLKSLMPFASDLDTEHNLGKSGIPTPPHSYILEVY